METLVDLLETAAERYGDRTALSVAAGLRAEEWTYARLWAAANAVARELGETYGVERGQRVLVWAHNSPRLVAAYFGCMLAGAILVPLDPLSTPELVARVAQKTGASAFITGPGIAASATATQGLPVIRLDALPVEGHSSTLDRPPLARPAADDVVEIVFTSGATGDPKGVILTHGNVMANVRSVSGAIPAGSAYRLLSLLPLSHMFEQTAGLYLPLLYGASVHYLPSRYPAAIFKALRRQRIVAMVVVPLVLDLMMKGIEGEVRRRGRWKQWQRLQQVAAWLPLRTRRRLFHAVHRQLGGRFEFFICGGAHLPAALAESWERLGVAVVQGYGATECAPVVAANRLHDRAHPSVGRPVQDVQVRLSEEGELLVKGPNVTCGYWQNEAATRAAFTADGWYRTGDLAEVAREGRLTIKGRVKDLVVLPNGLNVYPEDVEQALRAEDAIADCVVLGLPDAAGNPHVHAVVVPANGESGEEAARERIASAVRRANARLALHQHITAWTSWPAVDFPRTNTMKVKRHEVRAALTGVTPKPAAIPGPPATADRPGRVRQILAEAGGVSPEAVGLESDLSLDLHLDSLSRVEVALRLEEELGVAADEGQLAEMRTVAQVVALVEAGVGARPEISFPRWALRPAAMAARRALQNGLVFPAHRLVCRPLAVAGAEHLRSLSLPALFVANHASHLDTPAVLRALPPSIRGRVAVAAAADYFYRDARLATATSLALNTFPLAREGAIGESLEYCGELVDRGWSVLIYPEGTRSPSGTLQPFKSGVGLLARELRVPVVPVAIVGTYEALPKGGRWPVRGPVAVRFGAPLHPAPGEEPPAFAARLHAASLGLMRGLLCRLPSAGGGHAVPRRPLADC